MQYIFFIFRMMEDSSTKCSVGLIKEEICHKLSYVKKIGLINFKDIEFRKADTDKKIWNSSTKCNNLLSP